jgi:hypothetical protein
LIAGSARIVDVVWRSSLSKCCEASEHAHKKKKEFPSAKSIWRGRFSFGSPLCLHWSS